MKAQTVLEKFLLSESKELKQSVLNRKPYLGIPYPKLKNISKEIIKDDWIEFLNTNDCSIYELEILNTYVIGSIKNIDCALDYFNKMVYQAKEWSVVDSLCQKFVIARKYPDEVLNLLENYKCVDDEYVQRSVSVMLLSHYNNETTIDQSIDMIKSLNHPGYFNKMGIAWALATFMIRYPQKVLLYLMSNECDPWIKNKTIQKSIESFRIPDELKDKLKELR